MTDTPRHLAAEYYPEGDPLSPADRSRLLVQNLPDGAQRAWLPDAVADPSWFRGAHQQWIDWLAAHGITAADVLNLPCIERHPATRTISVGAFGPPEQPGLRELDTFAPEHGAYVKHRMVVQLEAEPLPFPGSARTA